MQTKTEVVFLPSAVRPGTRFPGFTSEAIRQCNLLRWRKSQTRYLAKVKARGPFNGPGLAFAAAAERRAA